MPNDIGLNAGVPTLAPWPGSAAAADLTTETAARIAADTTLQNNINALVTAQKLAADVSGSNSASPASLGYAIAVTSGSIYQLRARLFINTNNTGGAIVRLVHPGLTSSIPHLKANSTSVSLYTDTVLAALGASPAIISGAVVSYTGSGIFHLEMQFIPSASGNLDLTIAPNTNGQTMTAKAGSYVELIK